MKRRNQIIATVLLTLLACQSGCQLPSDETNQVVTLLRVRREEDRGQKRFDYDVYRETQAALLTSPFVIAAALRDSDINELPIVKAHAADVVAWLENAIQAEFVPNSELLRVRMSVPVAGSRHEIAQTENLLNAVVGAYLQEIVGKERLEQVDMLKKLRKRYQTAADDLKRKTDELRQLKLQLGQVSGPEEKQRLRQLDRLHARKLDLELNVIEARTMGSEKEQEVMEAKLKHVRDAYEDELKGIREQFGASGDLAMREESVRLLRENLRAVHADIQKIELRLESPARVEVIQAARFTQ